MGWRTRRESPRGHRRAWTTPSSARTANGRCCPCSWLCSACARLRSSTRGACVTLHCSAPAECIVQNRDGAYHRHVRALAPPPLSPPESVARHNAIERASGNRALPCTHGSAAPAQGFDCQLEVRALLCAVLPPVEYRTESRRCISTTGIDAEGVR